jgi:hypothetical protein
MAIRSVDKMWSRANSSVNLSDGFRKFDASFSVAYQILHDANEPAINIYQAPGIPAAGSSFPGFPFVFADGAAIETVSPIYSIVTINYSGEIGPSQNNTSPIFNPPRFDWDDVETEEEVDEDFDGNPIVTVNNEPISGIKRPIPDQTVTIRRNMPFFSPWIQAVYRQSVNSDLFLGWPAGTARLTKLSASSIYDPNFGYWEVTAVVQFRYPYRTTPARAWYKRVRHEGYYAKYGSKILRAVDEAKQPVTKPILLKANGEPLPSGDPAHWLEFKIFNSLPFNALGLT